MRKFTLFLFFIFVSFILILINLSMLYYVKTNLFTHFLPCSLPEQPRRTIPRRIHQIWNDDIVPAEFAENVKRFVKDNPPPLWEYYFWTKESGLKLLADKYPYLYERVIAGADETMRADILRYAVIHEYGGVYFDLDTVSVKPLHIFVDSHECAVAMEPGEHYFAHKTDFLLTNSALFCKAHHSFFKHLLLRMSTVPTSCTIPFVCTGPIVITDLFQQISRTKGDVAEVPIVQSSEIFQDLYDVSGQSSFLRQSCQKYAKLQPYQKQICDNWKFRGMDNRGLSAHALTYHTWYHVYGQTMTITTENNITNLVPHVKIYGRTF